MKQFRFEIFLLEDEPAHAVPADEFLDSVEDALFEAFDGNVTPGILGGIPVLYCTIDGSSLGDAVDRVATKIADMGLHPTRLVMNMNADDRVQTA